MSSLTLLNKERDFLELNAALEEKVKSLMVEVDTIINRQEDVIRTPLRSYKARKKNNKVKIKEPQSTAESDEEDSSAINEAALLENSVNYESHENKTIEDEYEGSVDGADGEMTKKKKKRSAKETIIRFLKAQVTKLQADIQAAQYELKKKCDHCKELEIEIKRSEEKREKLHGQLSSHKEIILKAEVSNSELQSKIQTQNAEITSLRKEMESLRRDLKSLNQLSSNSDLRLNRSLEENEKLRSSLKTIQAEERELRDQIRKTQEEKRLALKNSEKQRIEIVQAFKKQTQLVDNLKKQKAYLEASKEIQFIEEDFTKLLEWKSDKV